MAIDELPETQETLWLRLLGREEVQEWAILELLDRPKDDPRRKKVLKLLTSWQVKINSTLACLLHDYLPKTFGPFTRKP